MLRTLAAVSDDFAWRFDHRCLTFDVLSMSGNLGNSTELYDLTAQVRFRIGHGCAPYDFGSITAPNFPPRRSAR